MNKSILDWRLILRENFTRLDKLADFLELDTSQRELLLQNPRFVLNVPKRLASKMAKGTLDDPLFRQFVPMKEETFVNDQFVADPVGDAGFCRASKLLHKYQGRALLICTSACVVHCRYCFRQNFDYETQDKSFAEELAIIAEDSSIREIILSGGDPLSLSDAALDKLLGNLASIPHIARVRFHSRFPVGIPERINQAFIDILQKYRFTYWFVVHINHVREFDEDVAAALKKLRMIGVPVLNQSVLLTGVNDSVDAQKDLCEALIDEGILPYYLHQLDRVQGAMHFEVEESKGRQIIEDLAKRLPGYGVPKYVREISGQPNKTPLIGIRGN